MSSLVITIIDAGARMILSSTPDPVLTLSCSKSSKLSEVKLVAYETDVNKKTIKAELAMNRHLEDI